MMKLPAARARSAGSPWRTSGLLPRGWDRAFAASAKEKRRSPDGPMISAAQKTAAASGKRSARPSTVSA